MLHYDEWYCSHVKFSTTRQENDCSLRSVKEASKHIEYYCIPFFDEVRHEELEVNIIFCEHYMIH